ncbi:hypothetical protein [Anaerospora sp.]|uniref:hypothetical protein n=1 Tax=Anaerospora sp. TaxID=1960278 RepID=UPI00289BE631|nr:hypothetical protein [Anaerospora sp.]
MSLTIEKKKERYKVIASSATIVEAAKRLGLSQPVLARWARKNNAKPTIKTAKTRQRMNLYRRGWTDTEIAKTEGCHTETIRVWRAHRSLPRNEKRKAVPVAVDRQKNPEPRVIPELVKGFFQFLLRVKRKCPDRQIDVLVAAKIYREGLS